MITNNLVPPEQQQHVDELMTKYVLLGQEIYTDEIWHERADIRIALGKYLGDFTDKLIQQHRETLSVVGAYTPPTDGRFMDANF